MLDNNQNKKSHQWDRSVIDVSDQYSSPVLSINTSSPIINKGSLGKILLFTAVMTLTGLTIPLKSGFAKTQAPIGSVNYTQLDVDLFNAVLSGNSNRVKMLLGKGANINVKNKDSISALQIASYMGNLNIVKILMDYDADINAKDNSYGETALDFAVQNSHAKVVEALLRNGADINSIGKNGTTALIFAADKGDIEIVKILLKYGAETNVKSVKGQVALIMAAGKGHVDIVEKLLESGANVNIKGYKDTSALYQAALSGHVKVVEILLENGADHNIKIKGKGVKSPLDCILECGKNEL